MRGKIEINSKSDMEGSMQLYMAQYPMPGFSKSIDCN